MNDMSQLVPPCSVEAEQSVIGALLLDNAAADKISGMLQPYHGNVGPFAGGATAGFINTN